MFISWLTSQRYALALRVFLATSKFLTFSYVRSCIKKDFTKKFECNSKNTIFGMPLQIVLALILPPCSTMQKQNSYSLRLPFLLCTGCQCLKRFYWRFRIDLVLRIHMLKCICCRKDETIVKRKFINGFSTRNSMKCFRSMLLSIS